ncbi:MAG TPA: hypothetical protein DHV28_17395 [Ignavibacteriales bacterium]|nr:hypothetical protein [Ignavibacteriales bacterium]
MNKKLFYINEPQVMFGYNQTTEDPRDGLILFGPYEKLNPFKVRVGLIGTNNALINYKAFINKITKPIFSTQVRYGKLKNVEVKRPTFPGFEATFEIEIPVDPEIFIDIDENEINKIIYKEKIKRKRTSELVELYLNKMKEVSNKEDLHIDIWYVAVPRELYFACRPKSKGKQVNSETLDIIKLQDLGQTFLSFPGEEEFYEEVQKYYDSSEDFHDLMKARVIQEKIKIPIQIIVETTFEFRDKLTRKKLDDYMCAHLAWTQSTTLYYKLGKLPWKLHDIRDGVCYLGLVFKKLNLSSEKGNVCSAAQMFLKDGDGAVFRGNIGLWMSENDKNFHLDEKESENLLGMALDDYFDKKNNYPSEMFIHGRANFSDNEWNGFNSALRKRRANTHLIGIIIKDVNDFKLLRSVENEVSNYGVLRGLAWVINQNEGYLFSRGYIPRIKTSNSLEIPNPLFIKIARGISDIGTVMSDILALTKLNYNACIYGDGLPVTLRFSDLIGNILTSTPEFKTDQRQFKYYI